MSSSLADAAVGYTGHVPAMLAQDNKLQVKTAISKLSPCETTSKVFPQASPFADPDLTKTSSSCYGLNSSAALSEAAREPRPFTLKNPKAQYEPPAATGLPFGEVGTTATQTNVVEHSPQGAKSFWSDVTRTEVRLQQAAMAEPIVGPASKALVGAIKSKGQTGVHKVTPLEHVLGTSDAPVPPKESFVKPHRQHCCSLALRDASAAAALNQVKLIPPDMPPSAYEAEYQGVPRRALTATGRLDADSPEATITSQRSMTPLPSLEKKAVQQRETLKRSVIPGYAGHIPSNPSNQQHLSHGADGARMNSKNCLTLRAASYEIPGYSGFRAESLYNDTGKPRAIDALATSGGSSLNRGLRTQALTPDPLSSSVPRGPRIKDIFSAGAGGPDGGFIAAQFYTRYRPFEGSMKMGSRSEQSWISREALHRDFVTRDKNQ